MGASGFFRWLRSSSAGAWLLLALTVIVPLFAVYLLVLDAKLVAAFDRNHWSQLRIASLVVSAAGAFVVILLVWWLLNELLGLRRIFEVPWFGVGEDVENVGVVESIVRAGLFVVIVWLALGLCVLAVMGMSGATFDKPGEHKPPGATPRSAVELGSMVAAADKLTGEVKGIRDQLGSRLHPPVADPPIAPQLQRLGDGLRDIQAILASQDRKLDTLRQIADRLTRGEQEPNDDAILNEAKRLSGTLGEVRTLLDTQGRKIAALDAIERLVSDLDIKQVPVIAGEVDRMIGMVAELQRRARTQTDVLERIELLLKPRPPDAPVDPQPQQEETSCLEPGSVVAREVSASAAPRRYVRELLVFFDISGTRLTPRAVESLNELADDLKRVDQPVVSVRGSADAQGDPGLNVQLAERRAQVVKQFLELNVPQLSVQMTSARSKDAPLSEPYNRVARVKAVGICR